MVLTNQTIGGAGIAGGTWTIQSTNTASIGRFHDLAGLMEGAAGTNQFTTSRPGCLAGPSDAGTQIPSCFAASAAGGLSVAYRRGSAVVERSTLVGPYTVVVNAVGTVTLATADAVNSRIDRQDLQVFDGALGDNGGVSLTQILVTSGVAAGVPVAPAAPVNSIPLTQVTLPANTTTITAGMIADKRKSAGVRGAIRYLLPGDSTSDVGFMTGEMRDTTGVSSTPTQDRWNSTAGSWQRVNDLGPAATVYATSAATIAQISSTTYTGFRTTGSVLFGAVFVAPASGFVRIMFGANFRSNAGGLTAITPVVQTGGTIGSGTTILAALDANNFQGGPSAAIIPGMKVIEVGGLTPNSTYNISFSWKVASGTADANTPWVEISPLEV